MNLLPTASVTSPVKEHDLPKGWALATLPEVCEINPAKPPGDAVLPETPVSFVPMSAVDANGGTISDLQSRPFSRVRKGYTAFRENDVIFAKITPCMENGKAAIARGLLGGLGFGSTEFHVFRSNGAILPEYLHYFIRQKSFRKAAEGEMTGSVGQRRVPAAFLQSVTIAVPPLLEQRRIVAKVEELIVQVGDVSVRLGRMKAAVKTLRQSALAAAFSGRLTEQWAKHAGAEQGSCDPEEASESDLQEDLYLPEIPGHWRWSSLGEATLVTQYGTSAKAEAQTGGVPCLRMGNIQEGELDLHDLKYMRAGLPGLEAFLLRRGDVLFNRTNSPELVGKAALYESNGEAVFASYIIRLRVDSRVLLPQFACFWINSPYGKSWARSVKTDAVGQSNINSTKLRAMPIPLPGTLEQAEILRRLRSLSKLAEAIDERVQRGLADVGRLTQAILAKAFRGELVPTEAELARREGQRYEPASELLRRIKLIG